MKINQWLPDERPREKLLARGAASLSDAELLAIFLRIGVRGKSAVELARDRRELMQLAAVELPIRNGHTQHRRMALHVPAVLQPQCAEVVLRQFAEIGPGDFHQ